MRRGKRVISNQSSVINYKNRIPNTEYRIPVLEQIWFVLVIGLSVVLLALGGVRLSEADRAGVGYDALDSAETQAIIDSARLDTRIADGVEVLLIERHRETKAVQQRGVWRRRADVYLYEYASDTLIMAVVDVESGVVEEIERVQGVQLPLTADEIARAVAIVEADGRVSAELPWLTDDTLDTINIKAFTFIAESIPQQVNPASAACGVQRCAQLLLYTSDHIALDLMPIVNLSTGQLSQIMGVVNVPHLHLGGDTHEH